MKHVLFILALAIGTTVNAQLPPSYTAKLQNTLDSLCAKKHIKGASAAIVVPGMGTWKGVYGISHPGTPITSSMNFGLGSNTKTYIAALMLKLQEQGALSLNDTIGKWIPSNPKISGQITIRQLLNHTSGIFSYTDTQAFYDSVVNDFNRLWTPTEMFQFVGAPLFTPGTSWSYSNTGFLLAGMIAAQVTGMPVQQALRQYVLTPGGFNNTWMYPVETPTTGSFPHVWFITGSGAVVDGDVTYGYKHESFLSAANAAGALVGTAEDNAMFWNKLIKGQLFSAASMAEFTNTVRLSSNISYGLGVFRYRNVNSRVVYTHGGTGFGFINENLADSASGVSISLLTNQDSADNDDLFQIVTALHKITLTPPTAIASIQPTSSDLTLFPIPAHQSLQITWTSSTSSIPYTITDPSGRTLQQGILTSTNNSINTTELPTGTYFLRTGTEARQITVLH